MCSRWDFTVAGEMNMRAATCALVNPSLTCPMTISSVGVRASQPVRARARRPARAQEPLGHAVEVDGRIRPRLAPFERCDVGVPARLAVCQPILIARCLARLGRGPSEHDRPLGPSRGDVDEGDLLDEVAYPRTQVLAHGDGQAVEGGPLGDCEVAIVQRQLRPEHGDADLAPARRCSDGLGGVGQRPRRSGVPGRQRQCGGEPDHREDRPAEPRLLCYGLDLVGRTHRVIVDEQDPQGGLDRPHARRHRRTVVVVPHLVEACGVAGVHASQRRRERHERVSRTGQDRSELRAFRGSAAPRGGDVRGRRALVGVDAVRRAQVGAAGEVHVGVGGLPVACERPRQPGADLELERRPTGRDGELGGVGELGRPCRVAGDEGGCAEHHRAGRLGRHVAGRPSDLGGRWDGTLEELDVAELGPQPGARRHGTSPRRAIWSVERGQQSSRPGGGVGDESPGDGGGGQRRDQFNRRLASRSARPLEGGDEVRSFANDVVDDVERDDRLIGRPHGGQRYAAGEMAITEVGVVAVRGGRREGELAYRLQQPIPPGTDVELDEAGIDQLTEPVQQRRALGDPQVRGCLAGERTDEGRNEPEQLLCRRRQDVVARLQRVGQCAMADRLVLVAQQRKRSLQRSQQVAEGDVAQPRRGELQRQRDAVQPSTDLVDRSAVRHVDHQVRLDLTGPLEEQGDGIGRRTVFSTGAWQRKGERR